MTVTRVGTGESVDFQHKEDDTKTGFVAGGGIERAIGILWSVRADYLYETFGDTSVPHGTSEPAQIGHLDDFDVQKFRVGFSRKIGG